MIDDFMRALTCGEDLEEVYHRCNDRLYRWRDKIQNDINASHNEALMVKKGLQAPEGSATYKMAMAIIEDAKAHEMSKNDLTKKHEALRQAVEEEYIQLKQKEIDRIQRIADEDRQRRIEKIQANGGTIFK